MLGVRVARANCHCSFDQQSFGTHCCATRGRGWPWTTESWLGLVGEGIMLGVSIPPTDNLGKPAGNGMGGNL